MYYYRVSRRLVSLAAIGFAWLLVLLCHATPAPDPTTLVQGVESYRLQTPPSRLHIHIIFKDPTQTCLTDALVEFDGNNRRYEYTWDGSRVRDFFDGSQIALFDGREVTLRNIDDATSDLMFDPRLIGLSTAYTWQESLGLNLPYRTASSIKMIGLEQVGDNPAWHVQLITESPAAYQVDLWASSDNGFKVYKYETSWTSGHTVTTSYYENTNYPWLPSRVESQSYNSAGKLRFQYVVSLVEAEPNVELSSNTWSLAGLELPLGTTIDDRRIEKRLGTWNGTGIRAAYVVPTEPPKQTSKLVLLLLIFGVSIIPLFYLSTKSRPVKDN